MFLLLNSSLLYNYARAQLQSKDEGRCWNLDIIQHSTQDGSKDKKLMKLIIVIKGNHFHPAVNK